MATSTATNDNVRALVIDGPNAGRVMMVNTLEQEVALSSEEQVAWSDLLHSSRRVEERATRLQSKTVALLQGLRGINGERETSE